MRVKIEDLDGLSAVDLFEKRSLASIAISLKRIADALASAIEAPSGVETGHTDSTEGESAVGATSAETPALSSPRRG